VSAINIPFMVTSLICRKICLTISKEPDGRVHNGVFYVEAF